VTGSPVVAAAELSPVAAREDEGRWRIVSPARDKQASGQIP